MFNPIPSILEVESVTAFHPEKPNTSSDLAFSEKGAMIIRLIRHGKPDFEPRSIANARQFQAAITAYNASPVTELPGYADNCMKGVTSDALIVCSKLQRATDSAALLGYNTIETSELLNEADLPYPNRTLPTSPWQVALIISRIGWFFGYHQNADGIQADLTRASVASTWLAKQAATHGEVLAFGHGVMHRLIIRSLIKSGWRVDFSSGNGYWS